MRCCWRIILLSLFPSFTWLTRYRSDLASDLTVSIEVSIAWLLRTATPVSWF